MTTPWLSLTGTAIGAAGIALSSLLACDSGMVRDPAALGGSFSERDSAGVVLALTSGEQARASLGWEIEALPDLVLGTEATEAEQFHEIAGVRQLPSGQVLVVDGASRELRFFGSQGRLIARTGRHGEGPGEFLDPRLVPANAADSLLIWDVRLRRVHVYSLEGEVDTLFRPDSWAGGRWPLGVAGSKALVSHTPPSSLENRQPGLQDFHRLFSWIDFSSGDQVRVDSFLVQPLHSEIGENGVFRSTDIPFKTFPRGTVGGETAFLTRGDRAQIGVYDLSGELRAVWRLDESRRPVSEADRREFVTMRAEALGLPRERLEGMYGNVPFPDSMAVFESLYVDDMGFVWAERFRWDLAEQREWVVFDDRGRALGSIAAVLPLDIHQIGADFILGVATDSLGVERVERYRLLRDPAGEG